LKRTDLPAACQRIEIIVARITATIPGRGNFLSLRFALSTVIPGVADRFDTSDPNSIFASTVELPLEVQRAGPAIIALRRRSRGRLRVSLWQSIIVLLFSQ
jgi:hypothetical protein